MSLINKPQALDKQCMAIGLHRQTNIIHILIQNDGEEQKQHPLNSGHQKLTTSSLSLHCGPWSESIHLSNVGYPFSSMIFHWKLRKKKSFIDYFPIKSLIKIYRWIYKH
jgi:hypothetical protein